VRPAEVATSPVRRGIAPESGTQDLNGTARSCRCGIVLRVLVRWMDGVVRRTVERVEATVRIAARPASVVGGLLGVTLSVLTCFFEGGWRGR
jgi:hypothetical protein